MLARCLLTQFTWLLFYQSFQIQTNDKRTLPILDNMTFLEYHTWRFRFFLSDDHHYLANWSLVIKFQIECILLEIFKQMNLCLHQRRQKVRSTNVKIESIWQQRKIIQRSYSWLFPNVMEMSTSEVEGASWHNGCKFFETSKLESIQLTEESSVWCEIKFCFFSYLKHFWSSLNWLQLLNCIHGI